MDPPTETTKLKKESVHFNYKKRPYDKNKLWPCKKCDEILPTKRTLQKHRILHKPKEVDECTYKYDEMQELYICNVCSAEFQSENEIQVHVKQHEQNFYCSVCNKPFKDPYAFSTHKTEHGIECFECPLCTFKTKRRTSLKIHINNVHFHQYQYNCETCRRPFNNVVLYKEHLNGHLGVTPFTCIVCSKTFMHSSYMLAHQERMHRVGIEGQLLPTQCYICQKVLKSANSLENHITIKHAKKESRNEIKERPHLCDVCGQGFTRPDKLKIHYRKHTGDKPYKCSYCEKAFIKKEYMVMHERIHTGEKPYCCGVCGKCFNQDASLRLHMRGHTGERPFACPHCNTGCISSGALKLHIKSCIQSL